jgi:hypothetical protein
VAGVYTGRILKGEKPGDAGAAVDESRADHQPHDRRSQRPHHPALAARPCRLTRRDRSPAPMKLPLPDYAAAMFYKLGAGMVGHGHRLGIQNLLGGGWGRGLSPGQISFFRVPRIALDVGLQLRPCGQRLCPRVTDCRRAARRLAAAKLARSAWLAGCTVRYSREVAAWRLVNATTWSRDGESGPARQDQLGAARDALGLRGHVRSWGTADDKCSQ